MNKSSVLLVDDQFSFEKFVTKFKYMISVSVFTKLPMNIIIRCLNKACDCLAPKGIYYAKFFQPPKSACLDTILQEPGGI